MIIEANILQGLAAAVKKIEKTVDISFFLQKDFSSYGIQVSEFAFIESIHACKDVSNLNDKVEKVKDGASKYYDFCYFYG